MRIQTQPSACGADLSEPAGAKPLLNWNAKMHGCILFQVLTKISTKAMIFLTDLVLPDYQVLYLSSYLPEFMALVLSNNTLF
jgi:hypothetical protein